MSIITLSHGSGGNATHQLIEDIFYKYFYNDILLQKNDSSVIPHVKGKIAVTTNSFVVDPIFFNGGDIGKLSVCRTVNDLAMSGAKPLYITAGFIIEEGFKINDLEIVVESMAVTAKMAKVKIVAGDIKVVEKGSADQIYINTTGIGVIKKDIYLSGKNAKPGDKVIISGTLGDHGVSILSKRENIEFHESIKSDCALLNDFIERILDASRQIRLLRSPTRGGLAATLNQIAKHSQNSIVLQQEAIPVKDDVRRMCEVLDLDSLYINNEGKVVIIVPDKEAQKVLKAMEKHPLGKDAKIIGEIIKDDKNDVILKTKTGEKRILNMNKSGLLLRI